MKHIFMIHTDFRIANLIVRSFINELTEEEKKELNNWRQTDQNNEQLYQKIASTEHIDQYVHNLKKFNKEQAWRNIERKKKITLLRKRWVRTLCYAAILVIPLLIISITIKNEFTPKPQSVQNIIYQPLSHSDNIKAVLKLDNGQTISLGKTFKGTLQTINYKQVQIDSTTLNYQTALKKNKQNILEYNCIKIPRGSEYLLLLSDGTKVYLNSMSQLRYPVVFCGNQREVELEGEAYFEVSKKGIPFIVHTQKARVEVLGTVFNISAYSGDEYQATLVSGSVRLQIPQCKSYVLKPSQQASIKSGENTIHLTTVNTDFYTSWIKGKINFKDQRLEKIMQILARWYDINVTYSNPQIKDLRFGCNVNRYEDILPFIHILERTEGIHAKINGKNILFYN